MNQDTIFAASYTLIITGFNLESGVPTKEVEMQNSQANRLIAIPSEHKLLAAGYSYVFVFDTKIKSKKPVATFLAHEGNVADIALGQTLIVTCGDDKTIKVWERRTFQNVHTITTKSANNTVCLVSNGAQCVSGNEDGFVELHDMRNATTVAEVRVSNRPVRSVAATPDGTVVIVAAQDGRVVAFDVEDGKLVERYRINAHNDVTLRVAVAPAGDFFATTAANNTARIWSVSEGAMKQSLVASDERVWIWDVAFTQDGKKVITGGSDGSVRMFNCDDGRMEMTYPQAEKAVSCIAIMTTCS